LAAVAVVAGTPKADLLATDDGRAQRVVCRGGADLATVDLRDSPAADCETVTRRIFVDPTTGSFAQHRTTAEPDSFAAGSTVVTAFQVGRRAGAGGAAAIGWATSRDGGRTWRNGLLPGVRGSATDFVSDPTVAYDATHGTWLAGSLFGATGIGTGLYVSRSPDGLTWAPPVTAATSPARDLAFDKQWLACDNSLGSRFRGRCYLAYTDVLTDALAAIHSDDGGLTWSAPSVLARPRTRDGLTGAQPAALPDGTLVTLFFEAGAVYATTSRDGGATATAPVEVGRTEAKPTWLRPGTLAIPSVEVGGDGVARAVWASGRQGANEVVLMAKKVMSAVLQPGSTSTMRPWARSCLHRKAGRLAMPRPDKVA